MTTPMETVSWQNVLWPLVCVAISCMTQPTGSINGSPFVLLWYMRSSPIVCVFETLSLLAQLGRYCYRGKRIGKAAQAVREDRLFVERFAFLMFGDRIASENSPSPKKEDVFYDAPENPQARSGLGRFKLLRYSFFLFVTLPQTVKLFALSGIPWMKTWAAIYLVSFVVLESILIAASIEDIQKPFDEDSNCGGGGSSIGGKLAEDKLPRFHHQFTSLSFASRTLFKCSLGNWHIWHPSFEGSVRTVALLAHCALVLAALLSLFEPSFIGLEQSIQSTTGLRFPLISSMLMALGYRFLSWYVVHFQAAEDSSDAGLFNLRCAMLLRESCKICAFGTFILLLPDLAADVTAYLLSLAAANNLSTSAGSIIPRPAGMGVVAKMTRVIWVLSFLMLLVFFAWWVASRSAVRKSCLSGLPYPQLSPAPGLGSTELSSSSSSSSLSLLAVTPSSSSEGGGEQEEDACTGIRNEMESKIIASSCEEGTSSYEGSFEDERQFWEMRAQIAFSVFYVAWPVWFCWFLNRWSPEGTQKPAWAQYLG